MGKIRKRRLIAILAVGGILAAVGLWLSSNSERNYEGEAIAYWFKDYCNSYNGNPSKQTVAALKELGTNAVPYLVEQSFLNADSPFNRGYDWLINHTHGMRIMARSVTTETSIERAPRVLLDIKPPAHQLLPLLKRHLASTNIYEHYQVLYVLGTVGDGAADVVPILQSALKSTNYSERLIAIQSLGWIGPQAQAAVPDLIEIMKQPAGNYFLPRYCASDLGSIGSNAVPAIPQIRQLFETETNWVFKRGLAADLLKISPDEAEALAFLTNGLSGSLPGSDPFATAYFVGSVGPNAKGAVPCLLHEFNGTNVNLVSIIPFALRKIGVNPATYMPRLKEFLKSDQESVRIGAAKEILEVEASNHEALLVLMKMIMTKSSLEREAIGTLGNAGPSAAEAIPVLREVVKHEEDRDLRDAARRAIKHITAKHEGRN